MPWFYRTGLINIVLPSLLTMRKRFIAYVTTLVQERMEVEGKKEDLGERKDFFHHVRPGGDIHMGHELICISFFMPRTLRPAARCPRRLCSRKASCWWWEEAIPAQPVSNCWSY